MYYNRSIMLEKYLLEIGLNEKEAAIYLALLQVENSSVADIAKKTKLKRPTAYFVIEGLEKKGLISEVHVAKKVHYAAEPPERLVTFVERQKVVFDEKASRLKDIIPQIKSIQREQGERPIIKFFDGRDGAISAYEEFYEAVDGNEEMQGYYLYDRDLIDSEFNEKERGKFYKNRVNKKIVPTTVYSRKAGDIMFDTPGNRVRINGEKYPILTDITIVGDKILVSTLGHRVSSILIESKDLAVTLSSLIRYINDIEVKKGGER